MKKIIFLTVSIFLSANIFAQTEMERNKFAEHTDNWLQNIDRSEQRRISKPSADPLVGAEPVGDGLAVLLALAGGYMLTRKRRGKQE
jgi:hypothetical protein